MIVNLGRGRDALARKTLLLFLFLYGAGRGGFPLGLTSARLAYTTPDIIAKNPPFATQGGVMPWEAPEVMLKSAIYNRGWRHAMS